MPWCPTCDRFLSPPSVEPDGSCPSCHNPVETAPRAATMEAGEQPEHAGPYEQEDPGPVPLHLKILGVAMAVYLLWRLIQGIAWVAGKL